MDTTIIMIALVQVVGKEVMASVAIPPVASGQVHGMKTVIYMDYLCMTGLKHGGMTLDTVLTIYMN